MTIAEFVATHGIAMQARPVPDSPDNIGASPAIAPDIQCWRCTLTLADGGSIVADYVVGRPKRMPREQWDDDIGVWFDAEMVLEPWVQDARTAEKHPTFQSLLDEGYGIEDAGTDRSIWAMCHRHRRALLEWLGHARYDQLLECK